LDRLGGSHGRPGLTKKILPFFSILVLCMATGNAQSFKRFNFNLGGGYGGALGDVGNFTRASYNAVAGGGWNFSRRIGVKAEYMYDNLSFSDSVKLNQGIPSASGRLQSVTVNLFYQFPLQGKLSVYGIGGGGWYQRMVETRKEFLPEGTVCEPAWQLWDITCTDASPGLVNPAQTISSHTVSGGGYNVGGGFAYRVGRRTRVYVEGRYHHANTPNLHTTVLPVTVGLRW